MPVRFRPVAPREYMKKQTQEILDILQEECAEVIVEVSKCRRFGLESQHYKTGQQHQEMLEQELGDVLAMMKLLMQEGIITEQGLEKAGEKKLEKLKLWSSIFKDVT
jgi:NTP pyrophosphatase (non-canonical NTP hydrolase)